MNTYMLSYMAYMTSYMTLYMPCMPTHMQNICRIYVVYIWAIYQWPYITTYMQHIENHICHICLHICNICEVIYEHICYTYVVIHVCIYDVIYDMAIGIWHMYVIYMQQICDICAACKLAYMLHMATYMFSYMTCMTTYMYSYMWHICRHTWTIYSLPYMFNICFSRIYVAIYVAYVILI